MNKDDVKQIVFYLSELSRVKCDFTDYFYSYLETKSESDLTNTLFYIESSIDNLRKIRTIIEHEVDSNGEAE